MDPLNVLNLQGRVLAQPLPNPRKAAFSVEVLQTTINENEKRISQGIALAQVVAYIEETRVATKGSVPAVFRLAERVF